jgi:hypothetical protein
MHALKSQKVRATLSNESFASELSPFRQAAKQSIGPMINTINNQTLRTSYCALCAFLRNTSLGSIFSDRDLRI